MRPTPWTLTPATRLVLAAALAVALTGPALWGPGQLGAQQFPAAPPPPAPIKPAQFPAFQEATLSNGVRLLLVENHRLPVLSVTLSFSAGSRYDPAGKEEPPTRSRSCSQRAPASATPTPCPRRLRAWAGD